MSPARPAPSAAVLRRLERVARRAAENAHAPYSKFRVGAAVLAGSGKIYGGCNVENASYGLSNCAERAALFGAVCAGETEVRAVLLYTPTAQPVTPCGACRQVINEFGPEAWIFARCDTATAATGTTLDQLLPSAFGPKNLTGPRRPLAHRVR